MTAPASCIAIVALADGNQDEADREKDEECYGEQRCRIMPSYPTA